MDVLLHRRLPVGACHARTSFSPKTNTVSRLGDTYQSSMWPTLRLLRAKGRNERATIAPPSDQPPAHAASSTGPISHRLSCVGKPKGSGWSRPAHRESQRRVNVAVFELVACSHTDGARSVQRPAASPDTSHGRVSAPDVASTTGDARGREASASRVAAARERHGDRAGHLLAHLRHPLRAEARRVARHGAWAGSTLSRGRSLGPPMSQAVTNDDAREQPTLGTREHGQSARHFYDVLSDVNVLRCRVQIQTHSVAQAPASITRLLHPPQPLAPASAPAPPVR